MIILLSVNVSGSVKEYVYGEYFFDKSYFGNRINRFGIYRRQDGNYCFFITDSERGVFDFSKVCKTEEACEALMTTMSRYDRIYKKKTIIYKFCGVIFTAKTTTLFKTNILR